MSKSQDGCGHDFRVAGNDSAARAPPKPERLAEHLHGRVQVPS